MKKSDRLFALMQILRKGGIHRACDLAEKLAVSQRTIYRDIASLIQAGVPIEGTKGTGYRAKDLISIPPLSLEPEEFEVLNLALAMISKMPDQSLNETAQTLMDKIDPQLPQHSIPAESQWKFAHSAFSDHMRGFSFMPLIRKAITSKQKLKISYHSSNDRISIRNIRPLKLEHWGRIWTLSAWCENRQGFREFRLDLIQSCEALPILFIDEIGKTLH